MVSGLLIRPVFKVTLNLRDIWGFHRVKDHTYCVRLGYTTLWSARFLWVFRATYFLRLLVWNKLLLSWR